MIAIEPFDPTSASDDELRPLYDFDVAIEREREPDDPIAPFEVYVTEERSLPSYRRHLRWVATDGAGATIGASRLELQYTETNNHLAGFDVAVRADRRRQGIASRLLGPVVEAATADGRTVLGTEPVEGTVGEGFIDALGAEKRSRERRSRLVLADVDRAMLDEWVAGAKERAADYTLLFWEGQAPDDILEAFVAHSEVMNTAPRDDLDMDDWVHTPERYREDWAHRRLTGGTGWTLCARHEPTGELGGFTELGWSSWMGDLVWQANTGVDPAHRNRGLGRWLKAAMLQRVLAEMPHVARIDTWNAGSNRPMLAINVALGFAPVSHYGDWQIATADLATRL